MADIKQILQEPIFFEKNRVGRVYTGGALFADFFGDDSTDGFEPEEWVASSVKAINKISKGEKEGVSQIRDTDLYFDDLLRDHANDLLGDRKEFGVLTKVLDSAIRLPAQAHPDKAFSRKYFSSDYGKAESWIVLGCRKDACLYFGFNKEYTKEEFKAAVEASNTDKNAMERLLNRIPVKPGDVFFVPAKMAHAIGSGCLILEVQEPTDFTIQPEYYCGDYRLNDWEMYIGLDADTALDVFDFSLWGDAAIAKGRKQPKVLYETDGIIAEALITYEDTPCFAVERYTVKKSGMELIKKPAVYMVTEGEGAVCCNGKEQAVRRGDYFFLPHSASKTELKAQGTVTVVACLPPVQG